ncbi:hypothetical protein [Planctomicrobium piriforme]|uniref:Uncharacterized protein n=1 Tax=Planctomicrobium piriforme TaxID=1576369 RepID=A0A1I3SAZ1_9PLAN|nr:hypothetical protein [Planctomicrobium piriforme]SFJ54717.1 hypothetical protein SAMN05421753_12348 [Planctomicrobium piriforme]
MSQHNDSTQVVSRIRFAAFVTAAVGLLSLTLASAFGEVAIRTLLLATLAGTFVLGGGLLGLLAMHHVTQTHLPDAGPSEQELLSMSAEERRAELELRKAKGFLALFALSKDASGSEFNEKSSASSFRRTA